MVDVPATYKYRVSKSKSKASSTDRRNAQVLLIDTFGFETMPCSFCTKRGTRCMMVSGVSRCRECTRRGRSCDGSGVSVAVASRIANEMARIQENEKAAEQKLLDAKQAMDRAQAEMSEAVARLIRLRSQKDSLRSRGVDMARRNAPSLDELDEEERQESEAVTDVMSLGGFGVVDWSTVGFLDSGTGGVEAGSS